MSDLNTPGVASIPLQSCDPEEQFKERMRNHGLPFMKTLFGEIQGKPIDQLSMWQTFPDTRTVQGVTSTVYDSFRGIGLSLKELNEKGAGVFLTVNETNSKGRKKGNITFIRCLFADIDFKDGKETFDVSKLPIPATMVVKTGHGLHLYWCLVVKVAATPEIVQRSEQLLRSIQQRLAIFGADKNVCDVSRVLRFPGFYNRKREPCPLVELVSCDGPRYSIEEIEMAFPSSEPAGGFGKSAPGSRANFEEREQGSGSERDREQVLELARVYLDACEPAMEGHGGDEHTYNVVREVVIGFDLSTQEAMDVLPDFNCRCNPPWDEKDLLHKVQCAWEWGQDYPKRGWMLRRSVRPHIKVLAEHQVVRESIAAIAPHGDLYSRKGHLYRVVSRGSSHPTLEPVNPHWLRERLSERALFCRENESGEIKHQKVPDWLSPMILARKVWEGVDELKALVETPVYLADGRILSNPGFDEKSGLFLSPIHDSYPVIPDHPTKSDAEAQLQQLYKVVADFPFAKDPSPACHKAAWLAFVLTIVARFAIDGPVPFGLFDASTAGSGKGLLLKISTLIALGRIVPTMPCVNDEEELRKRIILPLVSSDRVAWLDDVQSPFGGHVWNALMTSWPEYHDRILGRSEALLVPANTVWGVTGNNVVLRGDSTRRALHIRLEPQLEHPEERDDFNISDLVQYTTTNHPELLTSVLTILKAFHAEGSPASGLPALGSFEAWSRLVRDCVYWITGEDVCQTQRTLGAISDEGRNASMEFLSNIYGEFEEKAFTSQELYDQFQRENCSEHLRGVRNAAELLKRGVVDLSVRSLGRILSQIRGQVHAGYQLQVVVQRSQGNTYRVKFSGQPEVSAVSEVSAPR
jgi:hypothetical protein